jgi:uncharacterized protein
MKIEIKKSVDGQFYFVLKARNGQILVTSETYTKKANCKKTIISLVNKLRAHVPDIIDLT